MSLFAIIIPRNGVAFLMLTARSSQQTGVKNHFLLS
jgi:hypothetical protein